MASAVLSTVATPFQCILIFSSFLLSSLPPSLPSSLLTPISTTGPPHDEFYGVAPSFPESSTSFAAYHRCSIHCSDFILRGALTPLSPPARPVFRVPARREGGRKRQRKQWWVPTTRERRDGGETSDTEKDQGGRRAGGVGGKGFVDRKGEVFPH
ncbi:hypothetical protein NGA_0619200 [Nannochloropsis gaditana CCMP526]|uniref:uncharacterized protein n=1 Tax=Nannochloropsis gaditana (strain CCMP526) TaxID=1093141 RepID=UPI00029F620A|nr:hypothetical protein NGA_0619200 [Nannochloropsis gaditana CCMP526]EKU20829.1 hypothetical protein NGA_0619200 [Nannochloropsis gaditana CCMP526]|eukprot:XP_005855535.1 hypothetical protein NGA_0619200 [Nannochloropsis gaditana CCMP526]